MFRQRSRSAFDLLAILLLLALTVLVCRTFQAYGATFDEAVQAKYGQAILAWYTSLGKDRTAIDYLDLYYYGGLFDTLAALAGKISPFGHYATRHLLNALVGLVGLVGAWRLARRLGGRGVGLFALVLLAMMPSYYGMIFINPKDIPFAVAMIWGLFYLTRLAEELPAPRWGSVLGFGFWCGAALGVRVGGVLLLAYLAVVLALDSWSAREGGGAAVLARLGGTLGRVALPATVLAWALMLLAWPWAQLAPLSHPFDAFRHFSHMSLNIETLFMGHQVGQGKVVPRWYLPVYMAAKMPALDLVLLALGAGIGLFELVRRRVVALSLVPVLLGALFPLGYVLATRPELYDAERHFLFVLPPLAVLASLSGAWLMARLRTGPALAFSMAAGAALAWELGILVSLHPYEYIYYNAFVGGVPGARGTFETDYWGESLADSARRLGVWVDQHGRKPGQSFAVALCANPATVDYAFPAFLHQARPGEKPDFYLATTRHDCQDRKTGQVVVAVVRDGAVLSEVKDLRPVQPPASEPMLAGAAHRRPAEAAARGRRG